MKKISNAAERHWKETDEQYELRTMSVKDMEKLSGEKLNYIVDNEYSIFLGGLLMPQEIENELRTQIYMAKEILEKREKSAREERIEALDDGTVKGLLLIQKKYKLGEVGEVVVLRSDFDGQVQWSLTGSGIGSEIRVVSRKDDEYGQFPEAENFARRIVKACRGELKREDIILGSFAENLDDEDGSLLNNTRPLWGIVLTGEKIYSIDKSLKCVIEYEEIDYIDLDEDTICITDKDGEEESLYVGDDESKTKGMYNLLMEIKEFIE